MYVEKLRKLHDLHEKVLAELEFELRVEPRLYGGSCPLFNYNIVRRSGTEKAANGLAVLPIVVVGRVDVGGAVEVEVVGLGAVRVWSRRPVVAVAAGVVEQVGGILVDAAAPQSASSYSANRAFAK